MIRILEAAKGQPEKRKQGDEEEKEEGGRKRNGEKAEETEMRGSVVAN